MPRKRSQAAPAKTGRTWSPIKGLTVTERGPLQFQARVRRTGRAAQAKTFEAAAEAEAWGIGIVDGTVKANKYRPFSASNPAERVGNS
jgi:hypothetical protein